jgi:hypothetical protein
MDKKKATKINIRHHAYINKQGHREESYYTDSYEVGKLHKVPSGGESDVVTKIKVVSSWNPHIEIEFKEWGELWLNDYVISIQFERDDYREIRSAKRTAQRDKDSAGQ